MKSLILVSILFASVVAQASDLRFSSTLTQFNLSPTLLPEGVDSGSIGINATQNIAILTLNPAFHCPAGPGYYCKMVMPAPYEVELPIVSVTTDSCGTKLITARKDARMVDGPLRELVIRDNSKNRCPMYAILPPVTALYKTQILRSPKASVSTFVGMRFERDNSIQPEVEPLKLQIEEPQLVN